MLVNPLAFLQAARAGGWAVGGFNAYNLESARAVITAAANLRAPVMVQTSEGAIKHAGIENIASIVRSLAEASPASVALHLDHGKSIEVAKAAVEAGYTSVMIDTSRLPLEENIAATREIVKYAHARGVQVEAEIGQLAGIEDLGEEEAAATFTAPEDAARFVGETNVDSLTITIGTSHGAFKFKGSRASTSIALPRSPGSSTPQSCCTAPRPCLPKTSPWRSATALNFRTQRASRRSWSAEPSPWGWPRSTPIRI